MSTNPQASAQIDNWKFEPAFSGADLQGSVVVLFTSTNRTLKALGKAAELAKHLGSRVAVVAVEAIPYALPLDDAPVPMNFILRKFAERTAQLPMELSIVSFLCRSRLEALRRIIPHNSPVMIGIRKSWRPTRDEKLAKSLRRAGLTVVAVETE